MIRSVDGVCVDAGMTEVYLYILDVEGNDMLTTAVLVMWPAQIIYQAPRLAQFSFLHLPC